MDVSKWFPELECIRNGDPYLAEIVKADDFIVDCEDDLASVLWAERTRLDYELLLLERWMTL